jgi:hypothetical protein
MSGPKLQLGIAVGPEPGEVVISAREEIDAAKSLRVAAVQPFRKPDDGGEHANGRSHRAVQLPVAVVRLLRRRLTVITRDERDHLDLSRIEPAQIPILDQVIGMAVVAVVADVNADIVEQCRILEPLALAIAESMDAACLVENAQRDPCHLLGVLRPVTAALAKFDHAAAAHVRVTLDLLDPRAVAMDVIKDEPLAEREVAQRDFFGVKAAQDRVEDD